ncbi:MAG: hypothetical protein P1P89_12105 [Desulfobacterales bacterium]|nr:hypothetical protein [Desulfobacterales bacterium]
MKRPTGIMLTTLVLLLGMFMGLSAAVEVTVFGPMSYARTAGQPKVFSGSFSAIEGEGTLIVKNGRENGEDRISSAKVLVNGK